MALTILQLVMQCTLNTQQRFTATVGDGCAITKQDGTANQHDSMRMHYIDPAAMMCTWCAYLGESFDERQLHSVQHTISGCPQYVLATTQ